MDIVLVLGIAALLGLIPANIAKKKGHSFSLWWFYGWMLFIVAIIHVNFIEDKTKTMANQNTQPIQPSESVFQPELIPAAVTRSSQPQTYASSAPASPTGSRFQELHRLAASYYFEGCPVIIDAAALLKDNQTGNVLAQIRLKNISERVIISCKVAVKAFELNGTELQGIEKFSYLDLNAKAGDTFGSKIPVYLPDPVTRRFSVSVIEVIDSTGQIWTGEPCEWKTVPKPMPILAALQDEELAKQFELEAGENSKFVPQKHVGLFLCSCGALNLDSNEKCYVCNRTSSFLLDVYDVDRLSQNKDLRLKEEATRLEAERLENERIAREKAAEEERIANELKAEKEKERLKLLEERKCKRKKTVKILTIIISVTVLIAIIYTQIILPRHLHNFSSAAIGDVRYFGSYEQDGNLENGKEEIEWIVLAKEDNRLLLTSKYILDCQKYNTTRTNITWEDSTIRKWLNETFYNSAFSAEDKQQIVSSSKDMADKIILLSINEVNTYFRNNSDRQCSATNYAISQGAFMENSGNCNWWLRSPGHSKSHASNISFDGTISISGHFVDSSFDGVRPAMWIAY